MPIAAPIASSPGVLAPPVVRTASPADARDVLQDRVQLWIWERRLRDPLREAVAEIAEGASFDVRGDVGVGPRRDEVDALLARAGVGAGRARTVLAQDVASLVYLHARLLGTTRTTIRLTCADRGSCPLFHTDHVGLRLLCTYAGPGTEWVPEHAVNRGQLGLRGRDVAQANAVIVTDAMAVQSLAAGHVAVLKGEAHPGNAGRGVVHRSPETTGRRLLLVLDGVVGR